MVTSFLKTASIIAAAAVTAVSADCSSFQRQGDPTLYKPKNQVQQVTAGYVCDHGISHGCTIPLQGAVHADRTTNITSAPDSELAWLYDLAFDSFDKRPPTTHLRPHKESLYSCITDAPGKDYKANVFPDWSGYVVVYLGLACLEGTVSGCNGPGLQDGDAAKVCFPRVQGSPGNLLPDVWYHLVHTSRPVARNMTTNPAEGNGNKLCKRVQEMNEMNAASSGRFPGSTGLIASWAGIFIMLLRFL